MRWRASDLFQSLIEWFVPRELRADAETHRRARLFVVIGIFAELWTPVVFWMFRAAGAPPFLPWAIVGFAMLGLSGLLALRYTGSLKLGGNLFMLSVVSDLVFVSAVTGGIRSTSIVVFLLVPIIAGYISGKASGGVWAVLVTFIYGAFYAAQGAGLTYDVIPPAPRAVDLLRMITDLLLTWTLFGLLVYYRKFWVQQQQRLTASERMAAVGSMSGGLAHEINTPLTVISLGTDRIEKLLSAASPGLDETSRSQLRSLAGSIIRATDRIAHIVQALSTFAGRRREPLMAPTVVRSVVGDTVELFRERLAKLGVELEMEHFEEGLRTSCPPSQVAEVMANLLANAMDAVEGVPRPWIRIGAERRGREIQISVSDSGTGVPPDLKDRIFEPFFTTKPVGKGMGLGLSAARGIVESCGGDLYLDKAGPPTRFVIKVPAA